MNPVSAIARLTVVLSLVSLTVLAQNNPTGAVQPIPPRGVAIPEETRTELEKSVVELSQRIDALKESLARKPALLALLPDVQVYHKAVDWALRYDEFFRSNQTATARALLERGMERVNALTNGSAPWTTATGLVVRAYKSKIDGSIQPYGLVVPPSYQPNTSHKYRLDFWFHGRAEQLSELSFVSERERQPGEFVPPDTFVVHLYGRYCNANRFAGEIDLFEVWEQVRKFYPIDENRVVIRGFSMGGASCWQFATHYPGLWAAAAPGAGFSETAGFLRLSGNRLPPAYEQKLWHLYDSIDYAVNLFNCPTVAYSGEIDGQKQAADMMAKALATEGIEMTHIIGPNTPHRYHPQSRIEINQRLDSIVALGRDPVPDKVKFTTWTLRYNNSLWVTVDALGKHWEQARVEAELDRAHNTVKATTQNVTALTFSMPSGYCPFDVTRKVTVQLDGQSLEVKAPQSDRSWTVNLSRQGERWQLAEATSATNAVPLAKRHGLQGPIDDAFLDSFIMVRPTGKPLHEKTDEWVKSEQAHAIDHWRRQFRGEAQVKSDTEITDADLAASNLVLWGDPSSNQLLARLLEKLPLKWDAENVRTADASYPSDKHVPVLIYPNPLNPRRYVVLNSGFTFREYDYLNNARQTPKLPDFAVIDISVPVTPRAPGGIATAGFFDEAWQFTKN